MKRYFDAVPITFAAMLADLFMPIQVRISCFRATLRPCVAVLLLCATAFTAIFAQQTPSFSAKIERNNLSVGNRVEVTFTLREATGANFHAPQFKGCRVVSLDGPIRGGGFNNGRPYYQESWNYTLEAVTPGTYSIAPATILANGQRLASNSLTLKIKAVRVTTSDVFLVGEFDHDTAFIGQQVAWRLKICTAMDVQGDSELTMPDFEGFTAKTKNRFDTRPQTEIIRNKTYNVQTLYEAGLYPIQEGAIVVDSATRRIGVVRQQGGLSAPVQTLLRATPAHVWVKPLPTPAPDGFAGLVGRYAWQVRTDRDSLRTGEALTLSVHLEGTGDPQRFAAPVLALPPGLETAAPQVRDEDVYENDQATFIHTQTLDYLILPKQAGQFTLNPQIIYFNTDSSRYDTLRLEQPLTITVVPGPPPSLLNPDTTASTGVRFGLEVLARWFHSPVFWGILAFFVLAIFVYFWWKKRKKSTAARAEAVKAPPVPAFNHRFEVAGALLQTGPPRAFYDALFKAFQEYISVRLDLPLATLSPTSMRQRMAERRVSFAQIQSALTIWQTCEQALFAGQSQSAGMSSTWQETNNLVQELDALLGVTG